MSKTRLRRENQNISVAKAYQQVTGKSIKNLEYMAYCKQGAIWFEICRKQYSKFQKTLPKDMRQETYIVRGKEYTAK